MSADGRFSVFVSTAANLTAGYADNNNALDVFLFDRQLNQATLVSHSAAGGKTSANAESLRPCISADGRFVAFESYATDLVVGFKDGNTTALDVYLWDRVTGATRLISHAANQNASGGNATSFSTTLSGNGSVVLFSSNATNLITGFTGPASTTQAYVFDVATSVTTLASHAAGNATQGGSSLTRPTGVSFDGQWIVLNGYASDLIVPSLVGPSANLFIYNRSTNTSTLATHAPGMPTVCGNYGSGFAAMSADGNYVTYISDATNLVSGSTGGLSAVYLYSRSADSTVLISHVPGSPTTAGNNKSLIPVISADGRYVAYVSLASDLVTGFVDLNVAAYDLFLYDRVTDTNTLVNHSADSMTTSGDAPTVISTSMPIDISADGQLVAYFSDANNLVPGFVNANAADKRGYDVYLYDRSNGSNTLVSHAAATAKSSGNFGSSIPKLSDDGQIVTFTSSATDLVAGLADFNLQSDVFVYHRATNSSVMASRAGGAASKSGGAASLPRDRMSETPFSFPPTASQISPDGRYFVYTSRAANLVAGQADLNYVQDVFLYDGNLKSTTLVSHSAGLPATAGNAISGNPSMSADGRFVVFNSLATDLVAGFVDYNGAANADLFVFDRVTGLISLVSHQTGSATGGGNLNTGAINFSNEYTPVISADGRYIAYTSDATDLVAGFVDNNTASNEDLYLYDRLTNQSQLVTHDGLNANLGSNYFVFGNWAISADGSCVVYCSQASNLIAGASNDGRNVYLFERATGANRLVSHQSSSAILGGNGESTDPEVSADGRYVVFQSTATNLVTGITDIAGTYNVFLFDRLTNANKMVSRSALVPNAAGFGTDLEIPSISADGRYVAYCSTAHDLVPGFVDTNGSTNWDVFLYDVFAGTNTLVSHSFASSVTGSNNSGTGLHTSISADGRFVGFSASRSTNLIAGYLPNNPPAQIDTYVFDRLTQSNALLNRSVASLSSSGNGWSTTTLINQSGSVVIFSSSADNLVTGDLNGAPDVFAYITPPPQVASLTINDGSVQRSMVTSLTVTFDEPVFFTGDPAAAFSLTRVGSAGSVQLAVSSFSNNPNGSITFTFSGSLTQFGSLIDGKYSLSIDASKVSNIANLDGNGDGIGGDNWTSPPTAIFRLFGDADGNRTVDLADFDLFRMSFGGYDIAFDFNNDGTVSSSDFNQFRVRFGSDI